MTYISQGKCDEATVFLLRGRILCCEYYNRTEDSTHDTNLCHFETLLIQSVRLCFFPLKAPLTFQNREFRWLIASRKSQLDKPSV